MRSEQDEQADFRRRLTSVMTSRQGLVAAALNASPSWLAATASAASAMPPAEHNEAYVVASLGDSYASGEGAIGPGWLDNYCHRSELAASYQAFRRQSAIIPPPARARFIFLACTGSVTEGRGRKAIAGPDGQLSQLPPGRIDALILSIGGNDLGFGPTAINLANPFLLFGSDDPFIRAKLLADMAELPGRLARTFGAIPADVNGTYVRHVFVTEYPDPTTGVFMIRCGNFLLPAFQGMDFITEREAQWASDNIVFPLNRALRIAVDNANSRGRPQFHFVSGIVDRFNTHGYCMGGGGPNLLTIFWPRYISTIVDSVTSQGDLQGAMHPNDLGQNEIRDQLLSDMSFLMLEPYIWVETLPGATSGAPVTDAVVNKQTDLQVFVGLRASGIPVSGARVKVDGSDVGVTDQRGRLDFLWTFAATGVHLVTATTIPEVAAKVIVKPLINT